MSQFAAYVPGILSLLCTLLGVLGGLWAAFFRIRQLLKAEIREYAASKDDLARVEGKIDLVVNALITRGLREKVSRGS